MNTKKMIVKKTQNNALTLLKNNDYFSAGNKRYFNVLKTEVTGTHENNFYMIKETAGEFIQGTGTTHTSLKMIAKNRYALTITGGFDGQINGELLHTTLKDFFNNGLGFIDKEIMQGLQSITEAKDYEHAYLFEDDKNGFYLAVNGAYDVKIIGYK